jgi:hypothetical protein
METALHSHHDHPEMPATTADGYPHIHHAGAVHTAPFTREVSDDQL